MTLFSLESCEINDGLMADSCEINDSLMADSCGINDTALSGECWLVFDAALSGESCWHK